MLAELCAALSALLPSFTCASVDTSRPDDQPGLWTQWRGPQRTGQLPGEGWPETVTKANLKRLWSVPLGPSYAGPIVNQTHVFTVETRNESHEVVSAYDRKSGEKAWEADWKGSMKVPFFARRNGSWVRSTPALDGDRLYVAGMRDVLACFDAKTGKEIWRVDFVERYKSSLPTFGFVCSPLVTSEHVYVQAGGGLCKLDKETGKSVWRKLQDGGGMNGSAFSSPFLATLGGREQLLVQTRTELCGVTPDSGDVLWQRKIKAFRGMNILTPITYEEKIFTSSYGGRSQLFALERVTENESEKLALKELWNNRSQGYMTSPVIIDGHAYLYLRSKRFACVNLETGEDAWISEPIGDEYWSLVAQGNKILALTNAGELIYLRANPEKMDIVSRLQISEQETWAHLAVDGDQVIVREQEALTAFRWTKESN